jgi:hypothetical protein
MTKTIALAVLVAPPALAFAQPAPPKPAPELVTLAAATPPSVKCTGTTVMPDGKPYPMTATITGRAELGGFWLHESIAGTVTNLGTFTLEVFTTFDPTDKQFHRTMLDSLGDYLAGAGPKLDFEMTGSGPFGAFKFRDHVDPKTGRRAGERSRDGKTWVKDYDLICK